MLRDDNNKPVTRPMPKPIPMPRREYEYPEYERPKYERPDYDYPMMPEYPNNMNPCPYPDYDMYGDREMDLEEMMRRNPALKRCVMDCIDRHNNRYPCRPPMPCYPPQNPCRPMPRPRPMPGRSPYRDTSCSAYGSYKVRDYSNDYIEADTYIEEMETYDFSQAKVENLGEGFTNKDIENEEE